MEKQTLKKWNLSGLKAMTSQLLIEEPNWLCLNCDHYFKWFMGVEVFVNVDSRRNFYMKLKAFNFYRLMIFSAKIKVLTWWLEGLEKSLENWKSEWEKSKQKITRINFSIDSKFYFLLKLLCGEFLELALKIVWKFLFGREGWKIVFNMNQ